MLSYRAPASHCRTLQALAEVHIPSLTLSVLDRSLKVLMSEKVCSHEPASMVCVHDFIIKHILASSSFFRGLTAYWKRHRPSVKPDEKLLEVLRAVTSNHVQAMTRTACPSTHTLPHSLQPHKKLHSQAYPTVSLYLSWPHFALQKNSHTRALRSHAECP